MEGATKNYYPVCLDLTGRVCVVVGGGRVATRKVRSLLACGAKVIVVSPSLTPRLAKLAAEGRIDYRPQPFRSTALEGAWLVVAATDDRRVNAAVAAAGRRRGLLVNVVDAPASGNFIVPAVVRRGPLVISVCTGGASPLLAKYLRRELAARYGPEYAAVLRRLVRLRRRLQKRIKSARQRQAVLRRLLAQGLLDLLRAGREDLVEERLKECISSPWESTTAPRR